MQIATDGLIIKEKCVGESDRLVTILTRDEGIIRAFAQQAKKFKNRKLSSTQLLCYSRFNIFKGRDKYIIDDAQPIEVFFDLRKDIERLSLAQYFCELVGVLAPEESEAGDFLRLVLNALHFLAKQERPNLILKSIVEMRTLSLAGYMPNLICCAECACYEHDKMFFLPKSGILYCEDCFHKKEEPFLCLNRGVLTALRHTIYSDFDKLFSFSLSKEGQHQLANAAETYTLYTLGRSFLTLDFYHSVAKTETFNQ